MNLYKFLKVGGKIRHWSFLAELLHVHARPKLIDPPNLAVKSQEISSPFANFNSQVKITLRGGWRTDAHP
jgi:hypothetical protein